MTPFLCAENVTYAAGGKRILDNVSLAVGASEVRALIGPNGAGKSTLVRCLAALLTGWSGRITVCGEPVDALPRRQLARRICHVAQTRTNAPDFTVREYVAMGRYAHSGPGAAAAGNAAADAALEAAGIAALADRTLSTLSGGEGQLAAIAAGLAQQAELMLLDEPAAFLDPLHQEQLIRLVLRLNRGQGISFIIVTHDINMAIRFTDKTLALRSGKVVSDTGSSALADAEKLEAIYAMPFSLVETGCSGPPLAVPLSHLDSAPARGTQREDG